MEKIQWTIQTVKDELPDVPVKINKEIQTWRISGRKNDFATVWNPKNENEKCQVAWDTIVHILNNDRYLLA